MKKLEKVYEDKILVAKSGKHGTQDFKQLVVSGQQQDDSFVFTLVKTTGMIHMTIETKEVSRVLREMRAFAPKSADWRISRKKLATDTSKVKAVKAVQEKVEAAPVVAIKKGRG